MYSGLAGPQILPMQMLMDGLAWHGSLSPQLLCFPAEAVVDHGVLQVPLSGLLSALNPTQASGVSVPPWHGLPSDLSLERVGECYIWSLLLVPAPTSIRWIPAR